jgi:hypothetical protein
MSDLDVCKMMLPHIVQYTLSPAALAPAVREFMEHRMPAEPAHRAALKAWAQDELAGLERVVDSGVSKIGGTSVLAETGRKMRMLQTVIEEIEAFESRAANRSAA